MGVTTFLQPDKATQSPSVYPAAIDASVSVLKRISQAFAPHEQSTPNMTVRLDAGFIFGGGTLTEVAAQSSATITAPTTNPRIDRIVVDEVTGAVSVVAGSEAASPTPPAITAGELPVAQVLLQTSTTQITNAIITDERVGAAGLSATVAEVITAAWTLANPTITGAAPATPVANRLYTDLVIKAWAQFSVAGVISDDVNVSSVTDNGAGDWTLNWATAFADANYVVMFIHIDTAQRIASVNALTTTTARVTIRNTSGTLEDPTGNLLAIAIGRQ